MSVGAAEAAALGVEIDALSSDEGIVTTAEVDGRDWVIIAGPLDAGTPTS